MSKKHHIYRYNPHTLSYEKVDANLWSWLKQNGITLLLGLLVGIVLSVLFYQTMDSPKERVMRRELTQYRRQLAQLNQQMRRADAVLMDLESRDSTVYRTIFGAPPLRSKSFATEDYSYLEGFDCSDEIIATARKAETLTQRLYTQSLSLDEVYDMARNKGKRLTSMPAIMPIPRNQCRIVSGFGMRYHPILHHRRMHTGIDLTAQQGTPVYATADGTVVNAGRGSSLSGYGVCVVIDHGYGYKTLYGHLFDVKVRNGQRVKRGELVGTVGHTGLAQGNHLHYEVIQNGAKVNPVYYFFNDLTPQEYEEVIEDANQENQCLS